MDMYILGHNQKRQRTQHEEVVAIAELNASRYR